ncbi:MAG: MFS transporter [Deltaproteobacteria bacterium]|nr:MAG: MFS transporter [Deltaproteobacteria bacterium]
MRPSSAWSPLASPVFRALWLASCVSNVGTWMHDTSAAWLMTGLAPSPLMVSLMQTATSLPFFLLALPAGALADIVDRRRLLLVTQAWMLVAATALGVCTVAGLTGPWLLLSLTFCMGLGNALNAPAWQATIPDLVPRQELAGAVALGGISVNVARAIGPALGGLLVAALGPGWVFLLNAASFLGVVLVLARWQREVPRSRLPPEDVPGAMRAGVRYVRHSAPFRAVLARTAAFVVPASALWALLPLFARRGLELSATGYGLLLGCLGAGAIAGAAFLPRIRARLTSDRLVLAGTGLFAAVSAAVALARVPLVAGAGLVVGGMAWMGAMSTLNVAAQNAVPAWVRARALAVGLLAIQGSMAAGSLLWGVVATHSDIPTALVAGAALLLAGAVASRRFELHGLSNLDLRPDPRWSLPQTAYELDGDEGPVLVTLEYDVDPDQAEEFLRAVRRLEPVRRRDGAIRWNVYRDTADASRWLEVFVVESWIEHLRQHERVTAGDRVLLEAAARFHRGADGPLVRHHIAGRQAEQPP